MSTAHDTLRAIVGPLVGNRYYPSKFPQESTAPTWPAIRGTLNRNTDIDQCGAGTDDDDDLRVQLDICATTYDACDALRVQVCTAMAAAGWIRQPGQGEAWDTEAKVHRARIDFVFQQSTP